MFGGYDDEYDGNSEDDDVIFFRMMDEYDRQVRREEAEYRSDKTQELSDMNLTVEELRTLPYDEYLLSPHWLNTAEEARKRAGYKCEVCGERQSKRQTLHVHHLTYENRGHEKPEDLEVLCPRHHRERHPNK